MEQPMKKLMGAFAIVVLYAVAYGAAQVASMTASRGAGADVSRNTTGLQARWEDGDSHAGLFLGGAATFDDLARGARPDGPSAFVLAVAERGLDDRLMTYLWTPRVEQVLRDTNVLPPSAAADAVRDLFRKAAARFSGLPQVLPPDGSGSQRPGGTPRALMPRPGSPRKGSRGTGSTQRGLPALSQDSTAAVIQAGWLEDGRRYGVLARGLWRVGRRADLVSDQSDSWLVAFEVDNATGSVTLLQAIRGDQDVDIGYYLDGQARDLTRPSRAWAARLIVRAQRAARATGE
jgi:hypothetical protein